MGDAFWAARIHDPLMHSTFLSDLISGAVQLATYGAIGLAACAVVCVAPFSLPGLIIGGIAGGAAAVKWGKKIRDTANSIGNSFSKPIERAKIITGSDNTNTNSRKSARAAGVVDYSVSLEDKLKELEANKPKFWDSVKGFFSSWEGIQNIGKEIWNPTVESPDPRATPKDLDKVLCEKHPPMPEQYMAQGSEKVSINSQPAVRSGDKSTCEAIVNDNAKANKVSPNTRIGGKPITVRPIHSGAYTGVNVAMIAAGFVLGGGVRAIFKQIACMAIGIGAGQLGAVLATATMGGPRPVHAGSGIKILSGDEDLDFALPGMLPIVWQRTYQSRDLRQHLMFGPGWSVPYEVEIVLAPSAEGELAHVYIDEQGRRLELGIISEGDVFMNAAEGLGVKGLHDGYISIETLDGLAYLFEPDPGNPKRLRLARIGDRQANVLCIAYDELGRIHSISEQDGISRIELRYDPIHAVRVGKIDYYLEDNFVTALATYSYNALGELVEVWDTPHSVSRRYAYANGLMSMHELATGLQCYYEWAEFAGLHGPEWRVKRYHSNSGEEIRFAYDMQLQLTHTEDHLGRTTQRAWNRLYQVTSYTNEIGATWTFDWSDDGMLLGATDPEGGVWACGYDQFGNLFSETDPLGRTTVVQTHGFIGVPEYETDAAGNTWRYGYDEHANNTVIQDPEGNLAYFYYDPKGRLVKSVDALGKVNTMRWDERSLLREHVDCSGKRTIFEWDRWGYLAAVTDASGATVQYLNDARGNILKTTLPDGRELLYQRDRAGQLVEFMDAAGNTTSYQRNIVGDVMQRQDAAGRKVGFEYDAAGRLVALQNENGQTYRFAWDAADRLTSQIDIDGQQHQFSYNNNDYVLQVQVTPSAPSAEPATPLLELEPVQYRFERDAVGRLLAKHTLESTCTYSWSVLDELKQLARQANADAPAGGRLPANEQIAFQYSKLGLLLQESTAQGKLEHSYDALGNLLSTTLPDGRTINRLYYGSGHLHQINIDGVVISDFERDQVHRETQRTQGRLRTLTQYDRAGRISQLSQQLNAIEGQNLALPASGLLDKSYEYDYADNLVARSRQRHGGGRRGVHGLDGKAIGLRNLLPQAHRQVLRYDATGRIEQSLQMQGNPGLPDETFRYDKAANLLDSAAAGSRSGSVGPNSQGLVHNNRLRVYQDKRFDWDGFGRLVCKRIGNHTTQRFSYDSEHRLVQADIETSRAQGGGSQTVWFEYDAVGRRTAKTSLASGSAVAQPRRTQFQWDGMRLLQEEAGHTSSLYIYEDSEGYEPLAKIESDLRPLRKQDAELDASKAAPNQQAHSPSGHQPQSFAAANDQHYEDGWPISPQQTQRSFTVSAITSSQQEAGAMRQFDAQALIDIAQSAPSYLAVSKTGLPMRVLYFHNDINGAPEELTDEQGEIVWSVNYQVWGNTFRETCQPSEITRHNIRFQGQYLDRETGLHYNTFRYYDPDVGRFTTTDPISLEGGFNLYQYAPNALMWIDPWGWCAKSSINRKVNNLKKKGFQEHHIASDKHSSTKNHPLFKLSGVSQQSRTNKIMLPSTGSLHPTRSIHKGRHRSIVNQKIGEKMDKIVNKGKAEGWGQDQYKAALREMLAEERQALRSGKRALNKNQRPGSVYY